MPYKEMSCAALSFVCVCVAAMFPPGKSASCSATVAAWSWPLSFLMADLSWRRKAPLSNRQSLGRAQAFLLSTFLLS